MQPCKRLGRLVKNRTALRIGQALPEVHVIDPGGVGVVRAQRHIGEARNQLFDRRPAGQHGGVRRHAIQRAAFKAGVNLSERHVHADRAKLFFCKARPTATEKANAFACEIGDR